MVLFIDIIKYIYSRLNPTIYKSAIILLNLHKYLKIKRLDKIIEKNPEIKWANNTSNSLCLQVNVLIDI